MAAALTVAFLMQRCSVKAGCIKALVTTVTKKVRVMAPSLGDKHFSRHLF